MQHSRTFVFYPQRSYTEKEKQKSKTSYTNNYLGHIELRTNSKILQKNKKKPEINELGTPKSPSNEHITIPLTKQKERSRSKLKKAIDQKLILMKRVTLN